MSNSIPSFDERVAPLRDILETAYKRAGRRTKKAVAKIRLVTIGWKAVHEAAFRDLQKQLADHVRTAYRDPTLTLCVFTDAGDAHWAAELTQCRPEEISKAVADQSHQPLAFLSGAFTHAQEHWFKYEEDELLARLGP